MENTTSLATELMNFRRGAIEQVNSSDRLERIYGVRNLQFLGESLKKLYFIFKKHNLKPIWLISFIQQLSKEVLLAKEGLNSGKSLVTLAQPSQKLMQSEGELSKEKLNLKEFEEFLKS